MGTLFSAKQTTLSPSTQSLLPGGSYTIGDTRNTSLSSGGNSLYNLPSMFSTGALMIWRSLLVQRSQDLALPEEEQAVKLSDWEVYTGIRVHHPISDAQLPTLGSNLLDHSLGAMYVIQQRAASPVDLVVGEQV